MAPLREQVFGVDTLQLKREDMMYVYKLCNFEHKNNLFKDFRSLTLKPNSQKGKPSMRVRFCEVEDMIRELAGGDEQHATLSARARELYPQSEGHETASAQSPPNLQAAGDVHARADAHVAAQVPPANRHTLQSMMYSERSRTNRMATQVSQETKSIANAQSTVVLQLLVQWIFTRSMQMDATYDQVVAMTAAIPAILYGAQMLQLSQSTTRMDLVFWQENSKKLRHDLKIPMLLQMIQTIVSAHTSVVMQLSSKWMLMWFMNNMSATHVRIVVMLVAMHVAKHGM